MLIIIKRLMPFFYLFIFLITAYAENPWDYINKGLEFDKEKKYELAVKNFEKGIELFQKRNEKPQTWILTTLAMMYTHKLNPHDYNKAIYYLDQIDPSSDKKQLNYSYYLYALSYFYTNKFDNFIKYSNLYLKHDNKTSMAKTLNDFLANYYYKNKDLEKALYHAGNSWENFWIKKLLSPRKIEFYCDFKLNNFVKKSMPGLQPGKILINMPLNTYYQEFIRLESEPGYTRIINDGRYNYAEFDFTEGFPEVLKLKITVKNQVVNAEPDELKQYDSNDNETGYFANNKSDLINIENKKLKNAVSKITKEANTNKEKAMLIQDWISKNITHFSNIDKYKDKSIVELPVLNSISEVYEKKIGHCDHFSWLYAGMLRILKIPARHIRGIMISPDGSKTEGKSGAHTVVEIYDPILKRWFFSEPQKYSLGFAENEHWLIIFESEMMNNKYNNLINFNYLYYKETSEFRNPDCVTFKVFQDL